MQTEIVVAGFGGQGVLFAGQILAYAAMDAGMEVTWIPSYGPEMRGGTANCTVIIADEEIGSPLVRHPQAVVAMNLPSLDRYESQVAAGGVLVVNASLVNRQASRSDLICVHIPAQEIAEGLGDRRMTNIVMVGALLEHLPILTIATIGKTLEAHLPQRHKKLLPLNIAALQAGAEYVKKERVQAGS
jgi:2-oxoglutarate ferredoxin oxidoreductase subunit gamma